jgi:hypothetical protein
MLRAWSPSHDSVLTRLTPDGHIDDAPSQFKRSSGRTLLSRCLSLGRRKVCPSRFRLNARLNCIIDDSTPTTLANRSLDDGVSRPHGFDGYRENSAKQRDLDDRLLCFAGQFVRQ